MSVCDTAWNGCANEAITHRAAQGVTQRDMPLLAGLPAVLPEALSVTRTAALWAFCGPALRNVVLASPELYVALAYGLVVRSITEAVRVVDPFAVVAQVRLEA